MQCGCANQAHMVVDGKADRCVCSTCVRQLKIRPPHLLCSISSALRIRGGDVMSFSRSKRLPSLPSCGPHSCDPIGMVTLNKKLKKTAALLAEVLPANSVRPLVVAPAALGAEVLGFRHRESDQSGFVSVFMSVHVSTR